MVRWWSEKGPGLKMLWIWTLGTAVVVMTNVVATRMRDMDKLLKEDTARSQSDPPAYPASSSQEQVIADE